MISVVDLDDTLVSSTILNNDSYNFALEQYGYKKISTKHRITRKKLKFIDDKTLENIIQLKQLTNSNQFIIYENNNKFFFKQNCKIVDNIKTNLFDINGYLIG